MSEWLGAGLQNLLHEFESRFRLKGKERSEDVQLRLHKMRDSENSPRSLRKTREALLQLTCTQEDDQGNMVALP